jgi:hypothetical protein
MASPTSDAAVEHDPVTFWRPDVPCLIASLTLVSVGCYILYRADPVWAGFATFVALAGNWPLLTPAERRKSRKFLPSSRGGWKIAIVLGLIVLAIPFLPQTWFEHLKGSPSSDRSFHEIMQNPVTVAAVWILLCSVFTWKGLRLRRVAANEAGSLA